MKFIKEKELIIENIPFGVVEVWFPDRSQWNADEFYEMINDHINQLKAKYIDYDRKAVFGEYPYFKYFKKYKKTYPVMMQLESILLKDKPFPNVNPVAEIAFICELETKMLLGTHDVERTKGDVIVKLGIDKTSFVGLGEREMHTYPGDIYGCDEEGIIFGMIAGADNRTCIHQDSYHVFYPVFGLRDQHTEELKEVQEKLAGYVKVLAPGAKVLMHLI